MHLQDAGVRQIVLALAAIDDLNVIADQSLQEGQLLTVDVDDVPLRDLLQYIARNLGVAFHVTENTLWVTAAKEPSPGGPQMETAVYELQHGAIPILPTSGRYVRIVQTETTDKWWWSVYDLKLYGE